MIRITEFCNGIRGMSEDDFVRTHDCPFLIFGIPTCDDDRVLFETSAATGNLIEAQTFNYLHPLTRESGKPVTTIGRSRSNSIVISNLAISKLHVMIDREGEVFFIQDAGSHNGTTLNDRILAPNTKEPLKDGDNVMLAKKVLARFLDPRSAFTWLSETGFVS